MTAKASSLLLGISLGLGLLVLPSCKPLARFGIGVTEIQKVEAAPADYQEVMIRGEVINQFSVLGRGAYEVQDDSGSLWILTQLGSPAMGDTVTVKGQAQDGITIGDQTFGVTLREIERF